MTRKGKSRLLYLVLLGSLLPGLAMAADANNQDLAQRVERLERIVKGQGLISLLGRVDQLQNEVQRLNGQNEELNHRIDQLKQSQRKMYLDLDKRLKSAQTPAPAAANNANQEQQSETADNTAQAAPTSSASEATDTMQQTQQAANTDNQAAPGSAPVSVENGEAAYQAALQTLRSGDYDKAISQLTAFPKQYPQSKYLPNVYYWQGEAYYVLRKFDDAIAAFQTVLDKFPNSTKVADAMLKRGFSEYEKGDTKKATQTLNTVIQQYPDTSAARLAKVRLDRIKQQTP